MDYSLLVGLHFQEASYNDPLATPDRSSGAGTPTGYFLVICQLLVCLINSVRYIPETMICAPYLQDMVTLTMTKPLAFLKVKWIGFFLTQTGKN